MRKQIEKRFNRALASSSKQPKDLLNSLKQAKENGDTGNRELVTEVIDLIEEEYTYDKYVEKLGGDTRKMSPSTYKMLRGEVKDDFNLKNLKKNHIDYMRGKFDAYEFMCGLEKLFDELIREFDVLEEWILTGKIESKEVIIYEKS